MGEWMGRQWIFLGGTALLLIGYFMGQSSGPAAIEFPDPGAARNALEMERAVTDALREPRAFPRASTLIRLFEGLTIENVEGASQAISARAGGWDPVDLQLFLTAWVHLDPVSAMRTVESWPIKSRREIGLKISVREWAASGHELEAVGYVQSIKDPANKAMAAGPLVRGWALGGDVAGALALAHRMWMASEKLDVVDGLVRGVLQVAGPNGVLEMMRGIDPLGPGSGDFEHRLVLVALNLAGREDPPAAAAAYSELVREGTPDWMRGSLNRLAGLWRNDDPEAALEWLLAQESGGERSKALKETVGTWANRDFEAAWGWYQKARGPFQPDAGLSADDSSLLTGIIRRMSRNDPALAAQWVVRVHEGRDRMFMMTRVANFWAREDAVAAQHWVDGLRLSDSDKQKLRETIVAAEANANSEERAKAAAREARIDD